MDNQGRNIQIAQGQRTKADFNANHYDIEELAAILKFEYIPLNKGIIQRRITDLKRKFSKQPKYQKFFNDAEKKLLENLKLYNEQTWKEQYEQDNSRAAKVLQNQFLVQNQEEARDKMNQIINQEKNIIGRVKLPINKTFATKNAVQGKINGMLISETKRIVNFDSHYRQILDPSSVDCENYTESNLETRLYTSSNYIVNLNTPLTNVIDITLDSVEIPNSWYTFSSDYGTTQFTIIWDNVNYKIVIENGNYSKQQLVVEINDKIYNMKDMSDNYVFRGYYTSNGSYTDISANQDVSKFPFPIIKFAYAAYNDKISVFNYDPNGKVALCKWYDESPVEDPCAATQTTETPRPGGKVDYNFGWLMGFRQKFSYIHPYNYLSSGAYWESNQETHKDNHEHHQEEQ